MKVNRAKEILGEYLDDSEIFAAIYTRHEADDHINQFYDDSEPELTDEEWLNITRLMEVDDAIWREIYGAFEYYIEATMKKRKAEANVSSE